MFSCLIKKALTAFVQHCRNMFGLTNHFFESFSQNDKIYPRILEKMLCSFAGILNQPLDFFRLDAHIVYISTELLT